MVYILYILTYIELDFVYATLFLYLKIKIFPLYKIKYWDNKYFFYLFLIFSYIRSIISFQIFFLNISSFFHFSWFLFPSSEPTWILSLSSLKWMTLHIVSSIPNEIQLHKTYYEKEMNKYVKALIRFPNIHITCFPKHLLMHNHWW